MKITNYELRITNFLAAKVIKNAKVLWGLFFLGLFLLFWWQGASALDPDFGWHLRMGQIILAHGVPGIDQFSYSMRSYPFVDHEWLMSVFIALTFPILHYEGLAALFAFVALSAVALQIIRIKKKKYVVFFIPFFLAAIILVSFAGVRTQVFTWFLLSLLLCILSRREVFAKWKFVLPFLFLLWVNVHGGFAIGIFTLVLFTFATFFSQRKVFLSTLGIFFLCLSVTFLNPYGWRIWWEVWMVMSDTSLHGKIQEWMPAFLQVNFSLWTFFSLSVFFIIRYRKQFTFFELALYTATLVAGLSSVRHIPLWVIAAVSITSNALGQFYADVKAITGGRERFKKAQTFFLFIVLGMILLQMGIDYQQAQFLSPEAYYPQKAVAYIASHLPRGRIFSLYGWGGYIIWKLPEKKVFIDGRMPSWRRKAPNSQESNYAFVEYNDAMTNETSMEKLIKKYHVDMVLLPNPKRSVDYGILTGFRQELQILFHIKNSTQPGMRFSLQAVGMQKVYEDNVAVLYERRESTANQ